MKTATAGTDITADDLASKIEGGTTVKIDTTTYYVLPAASESKNDISLNEAYSKMADAELILMHCQK